MDINKDIYIEKESLETAKVENENEPKQKTGGRPKGSTNKTKSKPRNTKSVKTSSTIPKPKKPSAKTAEKKKAEEIFCMGCGTNHHNKEFYRSKNPNHKTGFMPFCKNYIKDVCYIDKEKDVVDVRKFKKILMQMDAPFFWDLYESAINQKRKDTVGAYFSMLALNQSSSVGFNESVFHPQDGDKLENYIGKMNDIVSTIISDMDIKNKDDYELKKLVNFWGAGFQDEEYIAFQQNYERLSPSYNHLTAFHTEKFKDYIVKKVKADFAVRGNNMSEIEKWSKLADEAATKAKINPNQFSAADLSGGLNSWGELFRAIETAKDLTDILPKYKQRPQDKADFVLWVYVNYIQDIFDIPRSSYEDMFKFYDERKREFLEKNPDSDLEL